jgi:hypothetical protein
MSTEVFFPLSLFAISFVQIKNAFSMEKRKKKNTKTPKEEFSLNPRASFITIILLLLCTTALEMRERKELLSIVMINKHTIIENTCLLINNISLLCMNDSHVSISDVYL